MLPLALLPTALRPCMQQCTGALSSISSSLSLLTWMLYMSSLISSVHFTCLFSAGSFSPVSEPIQTGSVNLSSSSFLHSRCSFLHPAFLPLRHHSSFQRAPVLFAKNVMGVRGPSDRKVGMRKDEQEKDEGVGRVRQGCIMIKRQAVWSVCLSLTITCAPGSLWGHKNTASDWYRVVVADSFGGAVLAEKWLQATRWQNLPHWRGLILTPLTPFHEPLSRWSGWEVERAIFGIRVVVRVEKTQ